MTTEELLKPRYKVVADFPGCIFKVPELLKEGLVHWETINNKQCFKYKGEYIYPHLYPSIFQKLEWWEERDEKDLPKYVRYKGCEMFRFNSPKMSEVLKVDNYQEDCLNHNKGCDWISLYEPATEQEYLNQ